MACSWVCDVDEHISVTWPVQGAPAHEVSASQLVADTVDIAGRGFHAPPVQLHDLLGGCEFDPVPGDGSVRVAEVVHLPRGFTGGTLQFPSVAVVGGVADEGLAEFVGVAPP